MANRDSLERSSSEMGNSGFPANELESSGNLPRGSLDDAGGAAPVSSEPSAESSALFDRVLQSDIGITTLLTRLKQSIASARDFAVFLKKRSSLEEEHAAGLKKLCKTTYEAMRRPDSRKGSYAQNSDDVTRIHERMADNGNQFALSLHQMHEDLQELANDKDRGRKQLKASGLAAEKRVQDQEAAMEKAKAKYHSLAEDYDRARTGDRQTGRFGLKGVKSAAQVEEDLQRKAQAADTDYQSKVQAAQGMRRELLATHRPQTIRALQQLVSECDSGLTLQMQKFASFNEKLLLSNGLCVSPLKSQNAIPGTQGRSLRDVVYKIDNEQDLRDYVTSFAPRVETKHEEAKYEQHHSLQPQVQQIQQVPNRQPQQMGTQQHPQHFQGPPNIPTQTAPYQTAPYQSAPYQGGPHQGNNSGSTQSNTFSPTQSNTFGSAPAPPYSPAGAPSSTNYSSSPKQQNFPPANSSGPPQIPPPQFTQTQFNPPSVPPQVPYSQPPAQSVWHQNGGHGADLPPLRPVFGLSLEDLFIRDGSAVPMVVQQCLQAVDVFGLEVEGIYRLSGTASHITKLRSIFDNDASQVDFRNPENFYHDVNSVAGLLKQFFRDLPDPLLTREHYQSFIEAARIDDDITRRDSLHATINSLPDSNYATLRALTLHLYRVQEHSSVNRMNAGNLAICFGPTLMGSNSGPNIADAGWQVRVIDTILQNTYQIFDDD